MDHAGDATHSAGGYEGAPAAVADKLVGTRVGSIRVLERLGVGGMGAVYAGFDETLERRVALKSIRRRLGLDPTARARFLREARILSSLEHPNICRVHGYVEQRGQSFLVMELIDGQTLTRAADRLSPRRKLDVAIQIAEVLAAAHARGIVHRDIKPDNVMLTRAGTAKVLDFGLARSETHAGEPGGPADAAQSSASQSGVGNATDDTLTICLADLPETTDGPSTVDGAEADVLRTRVGALLGSPGYMSPEQARGEPATTASDMFSFGLLLHALFSDQRPHPPGLTVSQILSRTARGELAAVEGLDRERTRLIEGLKALAPAQRPNAETAVERLHWIRARPKRHLRRLVAAGVLGIVALATLKYTLDLRRQRSIAGAARVVADQRRDQAEDLIGFMVGDLREKLVPLGRLDLLDDVGEKALSYFASVPVTELSDDELLRRAEVLAQLGEVWTTQGDLPAALDAFEESLSLTQDLSRRDPDDVERRIALGAGHFWVGSIHWYRGEFDGARESFGTYLELAREVAERDPKNTEWQMEVAHGHGNLAQVLEAEGKPAEALEHLERRRAILESLLLGDPGHEEWRVELASTHVLGGVARESLGELTVALAEYRAALAVFHDLVEEQPDNAPWRERLATGHTYVGTALEFTGELSAAAEHFQASLDLAAALVPGDPSNLDWIELRALGEQMLGRTLGYLNRPVQGGRQLDRAVATFGELSASEPDDPRWQGRWAAALVDRAHLLGAGARWREALRDAEAADKLLRGLSAAEDRQRAGWLAESHLARARALAGLGRPDEARRSAGQARALLEGDDANAAEGRRLSRLARALLASGHAAEAGPLFDRLRQAGFVDPLHLETESAVDRRARAGATARP